VNHAKFIYRKKQTLRDKNTIYMWELIDKQTKNGVHFHGAKYDAALLKEDSFLYDRNSYGFSTYGIERHAATGQGTPSHTDCQVTGGNCWHDGTSLYAEERLEHVNPDDCDSEVWFVLEQFYASHFETEVLYA
jgi:hypothetical protein